jgi:hypothetical protein
VLLRHFEKQELYGIGLMNLRRRRAAKQRARELADRQTQVEIEKARSAQAEAQREVDARWEALWRNDPDVVLAELSRAFEDNRAPTAAVGVEQDTVHLTVLVPPAEQVIPERYPTTTAAGNLSLARMPKKISAGWYRELVAGHVLVSAKEAFAVAPGLRQASVVALRHAPEGGSELEPLLATVLSRMSLQSVDWAASRAWEVLTAISSPLHKLKGSAATLVPIDLHDQPDLATLASVIDVDDDLAVE